MLYEPFMLNIVWKSTERFGNLILEKYYILKWKMSRNPVSSWNYEMWSHIGRGAPPRTAPRASLWHTRRVQFKMAVQNILTYLPNSYKFGVNGVKQSTNSLTEITEQTERRNCEARASLVPQKDKCWKMHSTQSPSQGWKSHYMH